MKGFIVWMELIHCQCVCTVSKSNWLMCPNVALTIWSRVFFLSRARRSAELGGQCFFFCLCVCAPWMPQLMDRFSALNGAHFRVDLANLSHFYCLSARRSADNPLCHAAHNDVGADPLAGKGRRQNRFFLSHCLQNPWSIQDGESHD